ncbi:MAG: hypothetical protein FWF78_05580 [Defluviitaleaceae bacterium]|nr:hypothetical protein [Defluviitaleaceae bacterium]
MNLCRKKLKVLVFCMICSFFTLPVVLTAYAQETATPTTHRIIVNGQPVQIAGYNIRGTNYFMLMDLAYVLNGTAAQFNMTWDEIAMTTRIYTNTPYLPIGREMQHMPMNQTAAIIADTTFYVNGNRMTLPAQGGISGDGYFTGISADEFHPFAAKIHGNIYVQLRLIGNLTGFYIGFIHDEMTILINTNEMRDYYKGLNTAERFLLNFLETGVSEMYLMALDADGNLWGWWDNFYSHHAMASAYASSHRPIIRAQTRPDIIMEDVVNFATSPMGGYAFAITSDNTLWGWGLNEYGQLGDGTTENRFRPVKIMENIAFVDTRWEFGGKSTTVITTDGQLWEWGFVEHWCDDDLSLFLGIRQKRPATLIMEDVVHVSSGHHYTTAITSDGTLWGWGSNSSGVLLDETAFFVPRHTPVKLMDDVMYVSAAHQHIAVIRNDNSLWTWGFNDGVLGQLFDGSGTIRRTKPVRVMEDVKHVNVSSTTHAIRNDNSLWIPVRLWGSNTTVMRVLENISWSDAARNWVITSEGNLHRVSISFYQEIYGVTEIINSSTIDSNVFLPNIISTSLHSQRSTLRRLPTGIEFGRGETR